MLRRQDQSEKGEQPDARDRVADAEADLALGAGDCARLSRATGGEPAWRSA